MAKILIIDDDHSFCGVLKQALAARGYESTSCHTLGDGLKEVFVQSYDVVFLDVRLPDGNGLQSIEAIKSTPNPPEVIIITGSGDPDGAELAIESGAWDYIGKPASLNEMTLPVLRALEYRRKKQSEKGMVALDRRGIIGDSSKMKSCLDLLVQAAKSDVSVLVTGETGTGKELFARTIHKNSLRAETPFVVVDCSSLPESIVENILFGHEKGAFTGADKARAGLIKQADGGTLFLDEIGELPLSLQKSFLRVLQEHKFRRLGSKVEETSDFRLIAATNRNLEEMTISGQFRKDLLFRIQSFVIELPPLKDRLEDISELAMHFIAKTCDNSNIMVKGLSPDFLDTLKAYEWPGNVRELVNALQSALAAAYNDPVIYPNHLPVHIRKKVIRASIRKKIDPPVRESDESDFNHSPSGLNLSYKSFRTRLLEQGEKSYFVHIAERANGNIAEACKLAHLSKSRLYFFFQKYGISLSQYSHGESAEAGI